MRSHTTASQTRRQRVRSPQVANALHSRRSCLQRGSERTTEDAKAIQVEKSLDSSAGTADEALGGLIGDPIRIDGDAMSCLTETRLRATPDSAAGPFHEHAARLFFVGSEQLRVNSSL